MLTSQMIKQAALAAGADLCGIGNMERFEGAPADMDPRYLFPEAKSVVGFVFRIPRGVQRGIEEGTQFYQYPSMAYGGINEIYAPAVLYRVGKLIEDAGYEAMVYRNTGARGSISDVDGTPGNTISPEEQIVVNEQAKNKAAHHRTVQFTRPVREGTVAPDLQFHFRLAGVICGLGEIGWSKMLLTPEFGPLQRVAFLFTDAELEPDPIYSGPPLCRKCMACVRECPGHALSDEGRLNRWQCAVYYKGANRSKNPFMPADAFPDVENREAVMNGTARFHCLEDSEHVLDETFFYPPIKHAYVSSICGKAGDTACYIHLEQQGKLSRSFRFSRFDAP